jgi:hypothetical protein
VRKDRKKKKMEKSSPNHLASLDPLPEGPRPTHGFSPFKLSWSCLTCSQVLIIILVVNPEHRSPVFLCSQAKSQPRGTGELSGKWDTHPPPLLAWLADTWSQTQVQTSSEDTERMASQVGEGERTSLSWLGDRQRGEAGHFSQFKATGTTRGRMSPSPWTEARTRLICDPPAWNFQQSPSESIREIKELRPTAITTLTEVKRSIPELYRRICRQLMDASLPPKLGLPNLRWRGNKAGRIL